MDITDSQTKKILVAIPAKNEEPTILNVVNNIKVFTKNSNDLEYSIVVFNDESTDGTKKILEEQNINVFSIKKSFGLGNVFSQIVNYFLENNFDVLLTMDGDGQFSPEDISKILKPILKNEAEMVTGSRFLKDSKTINISAVKKIGNKVGAKYISSILKEHFYDVTCGFRAYTKEAILRVHTFSDFTYTQEVFLNLGFKKLIIKEVPIRTTYFAGRKSKMVKSVFSYIFKSLKIILKSILVYSPMKLFGGLGLVAFIITLVSGVFIIFWNKATGSVTPFKWVGVTATVSAITGVILYCVGILLQITSRLQITAEEQLYLTKKNIYGKRKY
ncbi:MAG: hypothetical protein QG654_337 [Patescibacteria group bacterium]|nr:hypothetical protein [Patescibacteria group bacterium]